MSGADDPFERMISAINANAKAAAQLDAAARAILASANTTSTEARKAAESVRAAVAGLSPEGAAEAFSEALATVRRDAAVLAQAAKRLDEAAANLNQAGWDVTWRQLMQLFAFFVSLAVIAMIYIWAKEPKIEEKLYGCTARWDAKTNTCKGKWIPLQQERGS